MVSIASVYVELAPRRREAVPASGRRTGGVDRGGQQGPVHGGGVEGVQVVEVACGWGGRGVEWAKGRWACEDEQANSGDFREGGGPNELLVRTTGQI